MACPHGLHNLGSSQPYLPRFQYSREVSALYHTGIICHSARIGGIRRKHHAPWTTLESTETKKQSQTQEQAKTQEQP
jgi:hypothetical protein